MSDEYIDVGKSPEMVARIFVALGLAESEEIPEITPLTGGVSSGIFRVDVASGSFCLKQALPQLRVAKEWKVPVERVFAEIDWLKAAEQIVPGNVPHVIGHDNATKSFVMNFLAGDHVVWKSELLAGRIDIGIAEAVGDVIGRIHAATAHSSVMAARFATDRNFYAIRLEPYLAETARMHPRLASYLDLLIKRTQNHRIALVHGDLSPKNILVGPGGPVLIDAECAWFGDPAFDLAFCLNHLVLKSAHQPQLVHQYMNSFLALQTRYLSHVTFEAQDELESRIATLLPALALARVDGKSPAEYLSDAGRIRLRNAAVALLHQPPPRLDDVRAFFTEEFSA
jgi:aminoglycoside phosphotransferase (APT) family kinase protein